MILKEFFGENVGIIRDGFDPNHKLLCIKCGSGTGIRRSCVDTASNVVPTFCEAFLSKTPLKPS